jgi:hypothetical protein
VFWLNRDSRNGAFETSTKGGNDDNSTNHSRTHLQHLALSCQGQCNSASLTVPLFKKFITHHMDIENGIYFVDHGQGLTYFNEKWIELPFIFFSRLINAVSLLTILVPTSQAPCPILSRMSLLAVYHRGRCPISRPGIE